MGKIGPGGMIPYGAPIDGGDIERRGGPDPAGWLTRLLRGVLQAAITAEGLHYMVPAVTDRITTPDGGVDASLLINLELTSPRTPGLVNPGRTVYQIKWRSKRESIVKAADDELRKLREHGDLPDHYVFATNVVLTISERRKIIAVLRKGCEDFPKERIVVVGGSELADRVNNDPRLRVAHFDTGLGVCTLEVAQEMAERRYGNEVSPPSLFDRDDEVPAIKRFLQDPSSRVLVVHGPQAVGKTRVVIEGLAAVSDRVIWATDIPMQAAGLVHVLDDSPYPAVLVVDDVDSTADDVLRRALEAARLKTIIVGSSPIAAPGAASLSVYPFRASEAHDFLGRAFEKMPTSQRGWLYDQFGGFPGLLLYGGKALRAGIGADPLREQSYEAALQAYEDRMTRHLTNAGEALAVLSVLPKFTLDVSGMNDIRAVSATLGIDPNIAFRSVEALKARHLLDRPGFREDGFYQVAPPLFGRRIARRVLRGAAADLVDLYERLSETSRAGLVRRVGELSGDAPFRYFLGWLFRDSGIFYDVPTLAKNASIVLALAEALPTPTARELNRVLNEGSADDLRQHLASQTRREIVHALERLVYRQGTFDEAAKGLLALATAENETYSNNATGTFVGLFHWKHPDIPKDARLRARLLGQLAASDSAVQRRIVAKAAAHSLETNFVIHSFQGEGVAPPEAGWRAGVWRDVHEAIRPVIDVLKRLAMDSDADVRAEAIIGLTQGVGGIVESGLIEDAVGSLEFVATLTLSSTQRARLTEGAAFYVADLKRALLIAEGNEARASVEGCLERGQALFRRLTDGTFRARFLHWLGPSPMRARRRIGEHAERDDIVKEGERIADAVLSEAAVFDDDLQNWVTSEDAQNAGYFLFPLGQRDLGRVWRDSLEKRIDQRNGPGALATYVAGWHSAAPKDAEEYLDAIAGRGGNWSEAAANATWRIGPSKGAAARIGRCAIEGGVDRARLAAYLGWGSFPETLESDEFAAVVAALRDGTENVDWALLDAVDRRWSNKPDERALLAPLAKELLTRTSGTPGEGHEPYHWDSLAAEVAAWDAEVGFELVFAHLQGRQAARRVFMAHHRRQLIEALSLQHRPRVVRALLDASLEQEIGWRVSMELADLINPTTDTAILLDYAEERGVEAARLIAEKVDAAHPDFWLLLPSFAAKWGDDSEVRRGLLHSITWIHGVYSGKAATLLPRREQLDKLTRHDDPLVRDIAREAQSALSAEIDGDGR